MRVQNESLKHADVPANELLLYRRARHAPRGRSIYVLNWMDTIDETHFLLNNPVNGGCKRRGGRGVFQWN